MKIDNFPGVLTQQRVSRTFTTRSGREAVTHALAYVLTEEQEAWLRRYFPEVENSRLCKMSGLSSAALHRFARSLGLCKSEKGMRGIRKRLAAHVRKLCEANGYYDTLRGTAPSEAAMDGTRQMWQEIREGKRKHPIKILRQKNPRKYRKVVAERGAKLHATWKSEYRRNIFGLERRTRLNVPMQPYTSSQLNHRTNALRRGYFYMDDCTEGSGERYNIYYDADTQRSKIFERNLLADGFRVKEWIDENV